MNPPPPFLSIPLFRRRGFFFFLVGVIHSKLEGFFPWTDGNDDRNLVRVSELQQLDLLS